MLVLGELAGLLELVAAEGADAFFPNLDAAPDWTVETVGEWQEENGLRFRYVDYVRRT